VARSVGLENDAAVLEWAEDCIQDCLRKWNSKRNWAFLLVGPEDLTLTAGTRQYDLPTNFKAPYAAVLVTALQPMTYVDRRQYIRYMADYDQSSLSMFYTCYDTPSSGKIELLPTGVSDTFRIWYYRPMVTSGVDSDTLDILEMYEPALLDCARARLLAEKGGEQIRLEYFLGAAKEGLLEAIADDSTKPDRNVQIRPGDTDASPELVGAPEIID
jgi:hypothetical protein